MNSASAGGRWKGHDEGSDLGLKVRGTGFIVGLRSSCDNAERWIEKDVDLQAVKDGKGFAVSLLVHHFILNIHQMLHAKWKTWEIISIRS